jgi:hypothetical protein
MIGYLYSMVVYWWHSSSASRRFPVQISAKVAAILTEANHGYSSSSLRTDISTYFLTNQCDSDYIWHHKSHAVDRKLLDKSITRQRRSINVTTQVWEVNTNIWKQQSDCFLCLEGVSLVSGLLTGLFIAEMSGGDPRGLHTARVTNNT